MTRPSPAHTHHSGRAAAAKSIPPSTNADPATEPHNATPMLTPTCRLVEVTAEAEGLFVSVDRARLQELLEQRQQREAGGGGGGG